MTAIAPTLRGWTLLCRVPPELGKILRLRIENGVLICDTELGGAWIVPNMEAPRGVVPQ